MNFIEEYDYYIPPDVTVNDDGTISEIDWQKVYQFDNNLDQFLISFTGMGMPPIRYIEQIGPTQHGATVLDFRLQTRVIQYLHRRDAGCDKRTGYWDVRGNILDILRPNRQGVDSFDCGRLRKVLPNGEIRDFSALVQQGPVFQATNPGVWDEWAITETIRFVCHDPTAFDPVRIDISWTIGVFDGLIFYESPNYEDYLTFPDNAIFGTGILSSDTSITYTGTWHAYPVIVITGPLTSPSVENLTLGRKIELDYSIAAGEIVTITTDYGNKTITNSAGTNLIGTLTDDSDMDLFIAPDPIAPNGVNQFSAFGADGIVGSTEIEMRYFTRYIGI